MGPPKDVKPRRRKTPSSFMRFSSSSLIVEQRHETVVHMQLLVAMKEGEPWIVGGEVDLCFLITAHHDHVLHNPGSWLSSDSGQFKGMAMQMDGMDVIAGIAHPQAIPLSLDQMKSRRSHHLIQRIRRAVDCPAIE